MRRSYPTEPEIRKDLIRRVAAFLKTTKMNKSVFGKAALGDPAFVGRLQASNFTIGTYGRVMAFISDNTPRRGNKACRT